MAHGEHSQGVSSSLKPSLLSPSRDICTCPLPPAPPAAPSPFKAYYGVCGSKKFDFCASVLSNTQCEDVKWVRAARIYNFQEQNGESGDDQDAGAGAPTPRAFIARSHLSYHRDGSQAYPLRVPTLSLPGVRPAQECLWSTYRPP
eukprot:scaffold24346_cov64-Phaeocystis_antarctica.AAC.4